VERPTSGNHEVLFRDDFRCVFPGCPCRVAEKHHLEYQSQGGSDDPGNLTSAGHHRPGQHGGRVMTWGRAPDNIYFQAGSPTAFGGGYPI